MKFRSNLVEQYRVFVLVCSVTVGMATLVTLLIVSYSFKKIQKVGKDAFVYSHNGASIHVYVPTTNGRTTQTRKALQPR
ncbi:hypothetical protein [Runella limosa]|uniref:hypothetical protein n=1 Tax=Runella limosa TaxID=370978 RepID=UPI00146FAE48|nr:hypothetical protein [Runella limosa]